MNINRKQFLGSLLAGATVGCIPATIGCIPAFASPSLVKSSEFDPIEFDPTDVKVKPSELEKCRNDILYFVDNYLEVNDRLHGKLKMSPQQREYLKCISTAPDYFFCAKGRQIGISTANNVFAYWKTTFFENQHVFIVEPNERMRNAVTGMFENISNTGKFNSPTLDNVHFIRPATLMNIDRCKDGFLTDSNNTFILDEFDFWETRKMWDIGELNRFLMNSLWTKELKPEQFERFKSHMIVVSSYCSPYDFFATLVSNVDDSRSLVLPSPTRGLKA